jgi:hypothetical protein
LNRADGSSDGTKDAGLLAVQDFCGRRRLFEEAPVASGFAGNHSHGLALPSDDAGV